MVKRVEDMMTPTHPRGVSQHFVFLYFLGPKGPGVSVVVGGLNEEQSGD